MLGSAPRSLRIAVQLLLVAIVLGAVYLYAPALGAVSPAALQHSLAREVGAATDVESACTERTPGAWRCEVHDQAVAGGSVVYELRRKGRRCWDATQVTPGQGHLEVSASGCVQARDQARVEQRL